MRCGQLIGQGFIVVGGKDFPSITKERERKKKGKMIAEDEIFIERLSDGQWLRDTFLRVLGLNLQCSNQE